MLASDDPRWSTLKGGYKMPLDPRPLVKPLEEEADTQEAWEALWDELHHQGDVGDASYAAVPLIVEAHRKRGASDLNPYAIVAIIDLARTRDANPKVPAWLSDEYFRAIDELAKIGTLELSTATDADAVRAILSVIALSKGLRLQAKFLIMYTEDELREIEVRLPGMA
jgi:hypothetical protein